MAVSYGSNIYVYIYIYSENKSVLWGYKTHFESNFILY